MPSADRRPSGIDHAREVRAAQIRLLYEQTPWALIATLANAAIVVLVLWSRFSKFWLLGWFIVCILAVLGRFWLGRSYLLSRPMAAASPRWGRRFLLGVTVNGMLWGFAGFFFFVEQSYAHQLFLAFVLAGMTSGAIATLSPVRNAYLMFLVPALSPYMARLVGVGGEVHLAMGGMLLLYMVMMAMISRRQHMTLAESLRLRFENLDLLRDLTLAKERQERVNAELAAQMAEKRHAQGALREAYAEMEQRVRERTKALAQSEEALRDADRRKDEFLAMLGHELRNPLTPISNAVQILKRADLDQAQVAWCRDLIGRQVGYLIRLVDDLLDVSRITRGKIELKKERLALADIVQRAVETSRPLIDDHRHELIVHLPPEPVWIEGDLVRLVQVVSNLLNNAAKYMGSGGQIWLTVRKDDDEAVISVRDTGVGIPAAMLPRVFDLFTQMDAEAGFVERGLGIGLALVRSLVQLHGGRAEARSEGPGHGSEFLVYLPLAATQSADAAATKESRPPLAAKLRILVADDNTDVADSLGMLFKALGAEVQVVYDGMAALGAIGDFEPAVVVLDLGMPGMDGYEVARQIRQQHRFREVTLIALTGWGEEADRQRSRAAGFDHHLVKPVDPEVLQRMLASLKSDD
jgi:signal transduction histidine kinase/ActR/RegA family two-component response regulator